MSDRLLNRELSWLDFNRRVLALAHETGIPPLERLKFVAICSSNLDEFFQVRVAGLKDQLAANLTATAPDGRTPAEHLLDIRDKLEELMARLVLLPRDDPQFRRNRERIVRDAERERISLEWDLGIPEGD